jgi:hypothetical protein
MKKLASVVGSAKTYAPKKPTALKVLCPEEMIFPSDFSRNKVTQKIPI